jgi:hypothetical protein
MQKYVDGQRVSNIVIAVPGSLVMQAPYRRLTYVFAIVWQISHEVAVYGCIVQGSWVQPRHSACIALLPVWTNANCGCLATEILDCLLKVLLVLWGVLRILQNDLPRSIQIDGPCVKWVQCTLCSVYPLFNVLPFQCTLCSMYPLFSVPYV